MQRPARRQVEILQRSFGLEKQCSADGEKNDTDQPVTRPQGKLSKFVERMDQHDERKQTSDDCTPYCRSDRDGRLAYLGNLGEKLIPQKLKLLSNQCPSIRD